MITNTKNSKYIIYVLGLLAALGPFSIDMYLPGFKVIAADLKTSASAVSLTLSSYFIGISTGQLLYGPLLDKYGRKNRYILGFCFIWRLVRDAIFLRTSTI